MSAFAGCMHGGGTGAVHGKLERGPARLEQTPTVLNLCQYAALISQAEVVTRRPAVSVEIHYVQCKQHAARDPLFAYQAAGTLLQHTYCLLGQMRRRLSGLLLRVVE